MNETQEMLPAEKLRFRLEEIEERIPALIEEKERLMAESKWILALLRLTIHVSISTNGGPTYRHPPKMAVLEYLKNEGPKTRRQIIARLEDEMVSDSGNRRQVLYSTIKYLIEKGELTANRASTIQLVVDDT